MGVPAFFRWLSRKYPSVVVECNEDVKFDEDDNIILVDATKPNPNGVEFDNLYLDMNGIIHPCTHPEDKPPPQSEDEMMKAIFECIERLFGIIRPRKLLYMAIDGVAPRAKMNQQRSRRFRAAKEAQEKKTEIARVRQELEDKGMRLPPAKKEEFHFDSNCITPGTPFMDRLSKCLHYFVHDKLNNDPAWQGIKVILSDANVPGEGEHKIVDYIRKQRAQPEHDPNTQHVLCGADADLIMLGLATHEVNFTIIREEFKPNQNRPCDLCGKEGHALSECRGLSEGDTGEVRKVFSTTNYIFVRLNVLREYLERELHMDNLPFEYEFDRALDDWIFMCFFVGNDFLPHLPSLEIRENAIDRLIKLYKQCCYSTGGWLTNSGIADLTRVQQIMNNLGKVEDDIFQNRRRQDIIFKHKNKRRKMYEAREKESANRFSAQAGLGALGVMRSGNTAVAHDAIHSIRNQMQDNENRRKRAHEDSDEEDNDEVKLYEEGFKDRYYESKFEVLSDNVAFRKKVANEYCIGLCWVLRYYFQGCASWKWYFPYHYSPFASDFTECATLDVEFQLGEPFTPMQQLMGVFPAASRSHVPTPWGELMIDATSTIIDFYPEDFKIDMNGKRMAYLGVALLPFVEERRLKHALKAVENMLTEEEYKRNQTGDSVIYVGKRHKGYAQLRDMYRMGLNKDNEVPIDGKDFEGMAGILLLADNVVPADETVNSPVLGLDDIKNNTTVTVSYRNPSYPTDFLFPTKKLEGATDPPRVLKNDSSDKSGNYRPYIGFTRGNRRASLGNSGHRMISHHSDNQNPRQPGSYGSVAPPSGSSYGNRRGYGNSGSYGNSSSHANDQYQPRWRDDRDGRGGRGFHQRGGYNDNSYKNNYNAPSNTNYGYTSGGDHSNSGGNYGNSGGNYGNSGGNSSGSYGNSGNNFNRSYNSGNNYNSDRNRSGNNYNTDRSYNSGDNYNSRGNYNKNYRGRPQFRQ